MFVLMQNKDSSFKVVVNGQNKRTKRRKESSESQHNEKAKRSCKKSKRSKEKSEESRRTCTAPQTVPEPAPSDSEEDYSLCAAPWCREPEGDEVRHRRRCGFAQTAAFKRSPVMTSTPFCLLGELGPVRWQLQPVVPPGLRGTVC